jgi:uncharacterized protein (TIGR02246 family)
MKVLWQTGLVLGALLLGGGAAGQAPSPQAAIETLRREQSAARSRGALDAFCSVYADDAFFVTPSGVTRGRQAVLERYRAKYPDRAALGTLTLEVLEVRLFPKEGPAQGASAAAQWTLAYPAGSGKEKKQGYTLIVFRQIGDAWKIVQDASM